MLKRLTERLAAAPRRRNFETVPLIVKDADYWDHEAATELLSYSYNYKQVWDNDELGVAYLGLMREAINGQVFAQRRPDFLAVSATHGLAHLALFSQPMWDKYQLARLTGGKSTSNTFMVEPDGVSESDDLEKPTGFYGPADNNIVSLQNRGAVFIACHDSIHAISRTLHGGAGLAAVAPDTIAADLTNNLIPGVVLVPSVVAFIVDLQHAQYTYVKT
jgi:intracellular sulfur oxidation DsrE/DsrF family protein